MAKSNALGGFLNRFFKFLFKPTASRIEDQLKNDPEIMRKSKEIKEKLKEINDFMDDNFAGYGGYSKSDSKN